MRCRDLSRRSPGKTVAIIGAGPAGLAAAGHLACMGHSVEVYDMLPEPGGLLLFGIPSFRIPRENVRVGVKELLEMGVRFHTRTLVYCDGNMPEMEGVDMAEKVVDFRDVVRSHDAVLIATGTWRSRHLEVPGADLPGVHLALDYLFRIYAHELGYLPRSAVYPTGRRVAVIGGGLTAIDAALEAQIQGAAEVYVLYRRTANEAPAGRANIERELVKRGIRFVELVSPIGFVGDARLRAVRLVKMRLGERDASGRPRPEPVPGSEHELEVDTSLVAIGEEPTPPFGNGCTGIALNRDRTVNVDGKFRTTMRGVFAAGDVVHGPSMIGRAMSTGINVALAIDEYLASGSWRT